MIRPKRSKKFRELNGRRCELIMKRLELGLTNEEDLELEVLQGRVSELLLDLQAKLNPISEDAQRQRIEARKQAGQ